MCGGQSGKSKSEKVSEAVSDGKVEATDVVKKFNDNATTVEEFTYEVDAYVKLSGAERGGNTSRGNGVNWKTIGIGLAEVGGGLLAVGQALAIEGASLGVTTPVALWRGYTGVIALAYGITDVMNGLYGHPSSSELIGEALRNSPLGQKVYHSLP